MRVDMILKKFPANVCKRNQSFGIRTDKSSQRLIIIRVTAYLFGKWSRNFKTLTL